MSAWRVIHTDSESPSGIAPICPTEHQNTDAGKPDNEGVYDCCPRPHIECWSFSAAKMLVAALTVIEAEVCS